jgi:peroxiredoxin
VDSPEQSRALRENEELSYRLLCDTERNVVRSYGLEHVGGGLDGEIIAVPAQFLLRPDGTIAWQYVSSRITQRVAPAVALRAIAGL